MMTIITARVRLTKAHQRTPTGWRTSGYGNAHWISVRQAPVESLEDVAGVVTDLAREPLSCVIRGEPLPGVDWKRTERRYKKEPVTFRDEPRQWLMVDADDVKEPAGLVITHEPDACAEYARSLLPDEFQDADCFWQASSSAGVKPGCRVHLWFWLSRPISSGQAKTWVRGCPVDRTIYNPIQPHYTADPLFIDRSLDPMRRRRGLLRGLQREVDVPDKLPEAQVLDCEPAKLGQREADLELAMEAVRTDATVRRIWTGERPYTDRSTAHFALGCALARYGIGDPDTIREVLRAYDTKHGRDLGKINRDDYAARTVGAVIAKAYQPPA